MPTSGPTVRASALASSVLIMSVALIVTGCASPSEGARRPSGASATAQQASASVPKSGRGPAAASPVPQWVVPDPGPLREETVPPHLLVLAERTLRGALLRRVRRLPGVRFAISMSVASVPVAGRALTLAAADPASYRRFLPFETAHATAVWQRVAAGDAALDHEAAERLGVRLGGHVTLGGSTLRVGALAPMVPTVDALVNPARGAQLGMPTRNAILVATSQDQHRSVAGDLAALTGRRADVVSLIEDLGRQGSGAATLTGGSIAEAVGSFRYRYFPDGTVQPDPEWVAANIRTETVPILGSVTCHRVMLPQLRAALQEVSDRGLATEIDAEEYGGCYVPRFIGRDPTRSLSLHTWGIAIDLNVPGNLRGTSGDIDRRVVQVFKKWGFAWGGDWEYTDPMHFELAALVR